MHDPSRPNQELIEEISSLKQRIQELELWKSDHKRVEDLMRESEEKYRVIFHNEICAICIFDFDTMKLLDINDAFTKMYGYTREELLSGMNIHDITAEHELSDAATEKAKNEGTIFIPLRYHKKKDGTIFPVEITGGPYKWKNKKVMFALFNDITERKRAEEALRESEEKYRQLIVNSHDIIYTITPEGIFTFISPAWTSHLGYTERQVIGKQFRTFIHPDDIARLEMLLQQSAETGEVNKNVEYRAQHADGSWIWYNTNSICLKDKEGTVISFEGSASNITERKNAEETLWKSRQQLQHITDNIPVFLNYVNAPDLRYKFGNKYFANLFGKLPEEIIGRQVKEILPADVYQRALPYIDRVLSGERIRYENMASIHGEPRWFSMDYIPEIDEQGAVNTIIVLGFDITDRKQAEEALRQSHDRLMTVLDSLDALVYIADMETHEILFLNKYGHNIWSHAVGQKCWQSLQKCQDGPCSFCTNDRLLTAEKSSTGIYRWEFLNTVIGRWFDCRDIAIHWTDGRMVRLEIATDITDRKHAEEELEKYREHLEEMVKERTAELESKNISLQGLTTTLKVLLKQREDDKKDMEERFVMNVRNLVLPYVEQMKKGNLDAVQRSYLDVIETHLQDIATPLMKNMRQFNLTPKEIKVAMLVMQGKPTKEIAKVLGIAKGSIDVHRKNIRNKIGLSDRKANLQSYLDNLS